MEIFCVRGTVSGLDTKNLTRYNEFHVFEITKGDNNCQNLKFALEKRATDLKDGDLIGVAGHRFLCGGAKFILCCAWEIIENDSDDMRFTEKVAKLEKRCVASPRLAV